jgi:hypothetical protein
VNSLSEKSPFPDGETIIAARGLADYDSNLFFHLESKWDALTEFSCEIALVSEIAKALGCKEVSIPNRLLRFAQKARKLDDSSQINLEWLMHDEPEPLSPEEVFKP